MRRKLRVQLQVSDWVAEACRQLGPSDFSFEESRDWKRFGSWAGLKVPPIIEHNRDLPRLLEQLSRYQSISSHYTLSDRIGDVCRVVTAHVEVNLFDLFGGPSDRDGVCSVLRELLMLLDEAPEYEIDTYVSGKWVYPRDALLGLLVLATLHRHTIDSDNQPDVDFGEDGGWDDVDDREEEPRDQDDEPVWEDPGPADELFDPFLSEKARLAQKAGGLSFPCTCVEIEQGMRRCAFLYHPDRNPEDPAAHERFVSLLQGFDELRALVGEE